ncbi:hypothetical protein IE81DRAFT_320459 [Ceraceosorus guamensis]|uniref:Metallo-beta-lactamase domain-containing protein n=1 Tax=Ceraceosorus guamensis TaxID=1522189 RepID=A0A316WCL1_9BASI|nr:hypothetical protein IE81DRAFT_320459 [Ceraceosorus guamensis]PWN45275.1 hypothetical protein IE81DRAFT_320459 [Ceraceosorus guamensis]
MSAFTPVGKLPASNNVSTVRVIDSTSTIHYPAKYFFETPIEGHEDLNCPAFSFLVTDSSGKRNVLFDLGIRKDWETGFPKFFVDGLKSRGGSVEVERDIAEILQDAAKRDASLPSLDQIESIIWSHHHFDHTGNPNLFPPHVSLIVGPGFKSAILPGYPADPESPTVSAMWEDRDLIELDFNDSSRTLHIGRFKAYDYFGDASFYLLNTPGHAPGHISGLARVSPDTFVLFGGDAAHHAGEIRPHDGHPLPANVIIHSSQKYSKGAGCPCEVLERINPQQSKTKPYYVPSDDFCSDRQEALDSLLGLGELDAQDGVFIILAHDRLLKDVLPLFPKKINDWRKDDLDAKTRWLFVDDFAAAADKA